MAKLTITKQIAAPPDQVFETFADIEKAAEHIKGIVRLEMVTEGPVGKGTRFRETRVMFKKEAVEEMEFTVFEAPSRYTLECDSCGSRFVTEHRFIPDGDGTRVELEMNTYPQTLFAKIMAPLGRLMMGTIVKCVDADLEDLKNHIEAQKAQVA